MTKPVCVLVGYGAGTGDALAETFAGAGYAMALISRSGAGGDHGRAYACDASDPVALTRTLDQIAADQGPVDCVLYNASSAAFGLIEDVSQDDFEAAFKLAVGGLYATARAVAPGMAKRGTGAIIVMGATASLRGVPFTAAFAPAKAGQRALAQSLARTYGPKGVHVALIIIDAVIDTPRNLTGNWADKPEGYFIKRQAIAETALALTKQDPSAWTFELDLRPSGESW